MRKPVVEVARLNKVFPAQKGANKKPTVAVTDVSFEIGDGEVLGLLGPNGAGKSTIISMLLGILAPTSGKIEYFGKNLETNRSEIMGQVTFASTYIRMPWRLTVMENLRVYGYMYGLSREQFERRAEKFLTRFGVWDQRDKSMNNLSAGQVTRVMLSKAFIPHPRVVLLDEPTASLDPDIAHQIRGFVKQQQQEFGTTMLYTSHNMDEVADVCDRVMFLKKGNIVAVDTPENLVKSMKEVTVKLLVADGEVSEKLLVGLDAKAEINKREVEVTLKEELVAELLQRFAQAKIGYSQITLKKPTLEDYFLMLSNTDET